MTTKETVVRNLGLTFDFVHQLIEQPEQAERLPDKFILEFVEKDFSKNESRQNQRTASRRKKRSVQQSAKLVKVKNMFEMM